jgi:succinyl-CoA synthetase beta subunit
VNVHEYQAKELLREYGVPVPAGTLATTPAEAEAATRGLSGDVVVVKAQVHAGGRGKAGGIKLAKSANEAKHVASEILGMTLRSHQTGPEGKVVRKVYVEAGSEIESELYLAVVLDRSAEKLAIIASTEGGMEIEEVAARSPEKILTITVDPNVGLAAYQVREIGFSLGFDMDRIAKLDPFLHALMRLFVEKDASLVEINPLVVTQSGDLIALDAKLNFDDSALYRRGSARARGQGDRPRLRGPRWKHRMHGERSRARDGDPRCDQCLRWKSGQLSRRRGWSRQGQGAGRVQVDPSGSQGEGDPGEHLRRDRAL